VLSQCISLDRGKYGVVSFDNFCNVIRSLPIKVVLTDEKQMKLLYSEMGGNERGIEYKKFCNRVRSFIYDPDLSALKEEKLVTKHPRITEFEKTHEKPK
jgi:hypothetical protein